MASTFALPAVQPGTSGDRADGDVVVAADHLHRHALLGEVLQRLGGVGAHDVFQQHERDRRRPWAAMLRRRPRMCRRQWPSSSTRCPSCAWRSTWPHGCRPRSSRSARSPVRRVPNCRCRRSVIALHLRAEENGTVPSPSTSSLSGYAFCNARERRVGIGVELGERGKRRHRSLPGPCRRAGRTSASASVPSVIVPVLSTHSTSTRASTSIAGSSCTRQRLLAPAGRRRRRTPRWSAARAPRAPCPRGRRRC